MRRIRGCRSRRPRAAPDAGALAAARDAAAAALAVVADGKKVAAAREALDALALPGEGDDVPWPGALDAAKLGSGAKALDDPACAAYREAWEAYRAACADHHGRAALVLLDDLLDRFNAAYDEAKAARAGVDFSDLELRVRDLLADPAARDAWAERFELIMIDEFQDTNRLQLDVLEALDRDNLFAVGDEFQSIYRFRHADVTIFRERRERLGAGGVRRLAHNFRSGEELLDVLNGAFAPGARRPLHAARRRGVRQPTARCGCSIPIPRPASRRSSCCSPTRADGTSPSSSARSGSPGSRRSRGGAPRRGWWRTACARRSTPAGGPGTSSCSCARPRRCGCSSRRSRSRACRRTWSAAAATGRRSRSATGSPTSRRSPTRTTRRRCWPCSRRRSAAPAPTRSCWSPRPAGRAAAARGRRCARPRPRARSGSSTCRTTSARGCVAFARVFAGERPRAERAPVEVLLERAIVATGYDLAVLARSGGERRLANLRKLMRLARDYERAEGPDLRGFVTFAHTQDLVEAREGEAALESDGLDAVRLMTIHRAKGLEFPVVCVADLGRAAGGGRERLLLGRDGSVGLKLAPIGGGESVSALDWQRLADAEQAADGEEERRLFYVAMTRACERLILSGGIDCERLPDPRPGGPPIDWIARALVGDPAAAVAAPETLVQRTWDGRPARLRCRLNAPATLDAVLPRAALAPGGRPRAGAPATALPDAPAVLPAPPARARPAPQRLSYSSLGAYARCGYRFYLERLLGLPARRAAAARGRGGRRRRTGSTRGCAARSSTSRSSGSTSRGRRCPTPRRCWRWAPSGRSSSTPSDVEDIRALVAAFATSPLCARLAGARRTRREAPFSFALDPAGGGPLVTGFLDAVAVEPDGTVLIVDYKSDRLEGAEPADVVERQYATQRLVYALAALRDGAPRAEVAYCFLERPGEPVTRAFVAAEEPALAERLAGLAGGVLEGRYPVAETPHRELCGDCPGRAALCSWGEEMTLRELPAPANVNPAG